MEHLEDASKAIISNVKNWYNVAAIEYQKANDKNRQELQIFQLFLSLVDKGPVLELGCGNGIPIGKALLEAGITYRGIDISETQIKIAKESLPEFENAFEVAEMIEYLKRQDDNSLIGVVSQFAMFHLPRILHTYLFELIKQKLTSGGYVFFTCAEGNWEGYENNWLKAPKMYWSNFSNEWYSVTLRELGYAFVNSFRHEAMFDDQPEIHYYMLFKKPD